MYKLTNHNSTIRLSDKATIPNNPANRDYQEYLEWLAQGNTPLPPEVPPVVIPTVVSMYQARMALLESNLLDTVEAAMANQSREASIAWEYATTVQRHSPVVVGISAILGFTEAQLDELFILAASIK